MTSATCILVILHAKLLYGFIYLFRSYTKKRSDECSELSQWEYSCAHLFCALKWIFKTTDKVLNFCGTSHFKFSNLIHTIMLCLAKSTMVLPHQNTYVHSEVPLNVHRIETACL